MKIIKLTLKMKIDLIFKIFRTNFIYDIYTIKELLEDDF